MNKTSILFLTLFLFSSCLAIESKLAEQDLSQEKKAAGRPFTKSAVCAVDTFAIKSALQSDPRLILLNHIIDAGDSSRMILSADECASIGIPENLYAQALHYVDSLNAARRLRSNNLSDR